MSQTKISLENAQRDAKTWHKILDVRHDGDYTVVTVVRGLSLGDNPSVLADALRFLSSPELSAFLASSEIQQKLFHPSKRGILLIDVAGYSKFDTRGQSGILTIFFEGLKRAQFSNDLFSNEPNIEQIIPTGDGCFIIFKPCVTNRVLQSVFTFQSSIYTHQVKILQKSRKVDMKDVLGIRIACHVGDVDFIIDAAGNRNAYGTGLNETARILQYGRPALEKKIGTDAPTGVAFFSKELDLQAKPLIDYFDRLQLKGEQVKLVDLGKVMAKHELELELRCFTNLPNHVAFPFNSPMATNKISHPPALTK